MCTCTDKTHENIEETESKKTTKGCWILFLEEAQKILSVFRRGSKEVKCIFEEVQKRLSIFEVQKRISIFYLEGGFEIQ